MIKVKICGITNQPDALAALAAGADALGFLVGQAHPSRSVFISAETAARIIAQLPPFCSTVLVTHLARPLEVTAAARVARVNTVQLHGESTPDEAAEIRRGLPNCKIYRAVHVCDETAVAHAHRFLGSVDGLILDTANREAGQVGGTGRTHDWNLSRAIVKSVSLPVILAGGLNPENVQRAIQVVQPYAVDVNTGVSRPDGTKDLLRIRLFIERAKNA